MAAVGLLQGYLNALVGESIMRDVRVSLATHLYRVPISFFTLTKGGEIMNRVGSDVDNIDNIVTGTLTSVITNTVVIGTTLVMMFTWDWQLAVIAVVAVPLMVMPLNPVGRRVYETRKKSRKKVDEIESITQETMSSSGIVLVKSFVREAHERERFLRAGTHLMRLKIDLAMVGRSFLACVTAMTIAGPALLWLGGGWFAITGGLQVGVIVAFASFIQVRLYGATAALAGLHVQIMSGLAVFERLFDYLDTDEEHYEPSDAIVLSDARGDIRFEDVSFSYDGARNVLDGVSFHVEPGKVAAFVGASGAGKTTIAQLVARFYSPQSGRVYIDGHDIRRITLDSLRSEVGFVTQEAYLLHDTIANNLRYAKPGATDRELRVAATAANIHEFIGGLRDGYGTIVGNRGFKLSGGERQRLAIARALLKNPRILVLDEATSALDSENEAAIQSAFIALMRNRTNVVIAHRLRTVQEADIIFVVHSGRIVEAGCHAELLARGGHYSRLWFGEFRDLSAERSTCGMAPRSQPAQFTGLFNKDIGSASSE
jgi:ATP-binding cassette subfamily B protein